MNIALTLPAADFDELTLCLWRWKPLGYQTFVLFDFATLKQNDPQTLVDQGVLDFFITVEDYRGWYASENHLMGLAFDTYGHCDWVVCAGTDMDPDPHFSAQNIALTLDPSRIMQPVGDRWDERNGVCAAERICGSPWISRQFFDKCGGQVWDERFFHYFADEKLRDMAIGDYLLVQRKDLTHLHRHPNRERRQKPGYLGRSWAADEALFKKEKAQNFPNKPWRQ